MRSSWSILPPLALAAAVLASPAAASAQQAQPADLFSRFQQACVQANAQPDRVRSAAKGWRYVKAPKGFDRARAWSRDGYTLVSGVQRMNRGERHVCSISGPADRRAEAAAQAWAGGRSTTSGPVGTYLLIDAAKAPRPATLADARDPNKVGRVSGLAVSTSGEVTTLGLSTFGEGQRANVPGEFRDNDLPTSFITAWDFVHPPSR